MEGNTVIDGVKVRYVVEHKPNKNIRIKVCRNGLLYITAPLKTPRYRIEEVLEKKKEFLLKALARQSKSGVYYFGERLDVNIVNSNKTLAVCKDGVLTVYASDAQKVDSAIKAFYKRETEKHYAGFAEFVCKKFLDEGFSIPPHQVVFKQMKSAWGVCSRQKSKITLTTCLCALPFFVATYIVVHEYAHFVEFNHSKRFYAVIEKILPDYRDAELALKQTPFMYKGGIDFNSNEQ
jgi:predicted metal-dependent hydrolase